jgi:hypothetical protein
MSEEFTGADGNQGMGDIVNLRVVRKRTSRRREEARAAENRAVHGRSRSDREDEAQKRNKAARHLDQHRIETGDDR